MRSELALVRAVFDGDKQALVELNDLFEDHDIKKLEVIPLYRISINFCSTIPEDTLPEEVKYDHCLTFLFLNFDLNFGKSDEYIYNTDYDFLIYKIYKKAILNKDARLRPNARDFIKGERLITLDQCNLWFLKNVKDITRFTLENNIYKENQ